MIWFSGPDFGGRANPAAQTLTVTQLKYADMTYIGIRKENWGSLRDYGIVEIVGRRAPAARLALTASLLYILYQPLPRALDS